MYTFYFLLLHTGLRFNEARQLKRTDLDLTERQLFVRHGKGQKTRYVPLHDELVNVLIRYLDVQPSNGSLFQNTAGGLLDPNQARKQLRISSQQVLHRTLRPHDLRVTFATTLYREHRADLLTVMRLART